MALTRSILPRWLAAKYPNDCAGTQAPDCTGRVNRGDQALYYPADRRILCAPCGQLAQATQTADELIAAAPSFAERLEAERSHLVTKADRYEGYAESAARRSEAAGTASAAISERFAFGQPIIVGHHSEGRARRDQARMHALEGRRFEEHDKATEWQQRAEGIDRALDRSEDVGYLMRRRDEAERAIRDCERRIAGDGIHRGPASGPYLAQMQAKQADYRERLAYYEARIAELGGPHFGPHNVRKGDAVKIIGTWYEARRINKKSVTIPSLVGGSWTDTVNWDKVEGHRAAGSGGE